MNLKAKDINEVLQDRAVADNRFGMTQRYSDSDLEILTEEGITEYLLRSCLDVCIDTGFVPVRVLHYDSFVDEEGYEVFSVTIIGRKILSE